MTGDRTAVLQMLRKAMVDGDVDVLREWVRATIRTNKLQRASARILDPSGADTLHNRNQ